MYPKRTGRLFTCLLATILYLQALPFIYPVQAFSQRTFNIDTLKLKPDEAEQMFVENNLALMASKLQIDQAEAAIIQTKVWPNPVLEISNVQITTRPGTDPSPGLLGSTFWQNRTFSAEIEQLIQLAGKRKKSIALEQQNKEIAKIEFSNLLISIKAELRKELADLSYYQQLTDDLLYQKEIIDQLISFQQVQLDSGNISKADLFRFKALQISLHTEINELSKEILEKQHILKNMMAISADKYIVIDNNLTNPDIVKLKNYSLHQLVTMAKENNIHLKLAESELSSSGLQWELEKANSVPDLSLHINYDRAGANHLDFIGVGISMDLPIFNRNRGNIKQAGLEIQKKELFKQDIHIDLQNAIIKNWSDLQQNILLFETIDKDYLNQLNEIIRSISVIFKERNMELLMFLDFFASFRESKEQYYKVLKNIYIKKEELNYLIGKDL